jgi:hypothetical protein
VSFAPNQQKQGSCRGDRSITSCPQVQGSTQVPHTSGISTRLMLMTAAQATSRQSTPSRWSKVSERLLCRRAVGEGKKGEDPRQSIVAAFELGSAPGEFQVSLSSRHPAIHLSTLATKELPSLRQSCVYIGQTGQEPTSRPRHHTPLISLPGIRSVDQPPIFFSHSPSASPSPPPGPLARTPTRPRTTAAESKLDFLPCSSGHLQVRVHTRYFCIRLPVAHPDSNPMYLVAPQKSMVPILV